MQDINASISDTSQISPAIKQIIREREECCQGLEELCQRCDLKAEVEFENICRKWQNTSNAPKEYQELLDKRFNHARDNFKNRLAQLREHASERAERVDKLEWLCVESAKLCSTESESLSRQKLKKLRNDWNCLSRYTADIDVLQKKFDENFRRLEELLAPLEESRNKALEELKNACEELEQIIANPNPDESRARKAELDGIVERALSLTKDDYSATALKQNYQRLNKKYADRLHQLYQVRDLARWEHYTLKLDLCSQLEKLLEVKEAGLPQASKKLKHLRTTWKNIGSVPHEKSEEIWLRFKAGCDRLQQRISTYFDELAAKREEIVQQKIKLCEEAEDNQHREDWSDGTSKFKNLQRLWREVGFAHPEQEKLLYERFRAACDFFFNARKIHYQHVKEYQTEAALAKRQLCVEAEKILELPYRDAHQQIPLLWQRWKKIDSAGREDHNLYHRFKKTFDRYYDSLREQRQSNLQVKYDLLAEFEKLHDSLNTASFESVKQQYSRLLGQWRDTGPVPHANEAEILEKYGQLNKTIHEYLEKTSREKKMLQLSCHLQIERIMSEALAALLARDQAAIDATKENWDKLTLSEKAGYEHEFSEICRLSTETNSGVINRFLSQSEENLKQRKIICLELEKITGTSTEKNNDATLSAKDLAEELSLAITSNFATHRNTQHLSDKEINNMIKRWFKIGVVPITELNPLYERFEHLLQHLNS